MSEADLTTATRVREGHILVHRGIAGVHLQGARQPAQAFLQLAAFMKIMPAS